MASWQYLTIFYSDKRKTLSRLSLFHVIVKVSCPAMLHLHLAALLERNMRWPLSLTRQFSSFLGNPIISAVHLLILHGSNKWVVQSVSSIYTYTYILIYTISYTIFLRNIIIAGGYGHGYRDDILEYDPVEDSILSLGHMTQTREDHAVSVVQVQDYSMWCKWPASGNILIDDEIIMFVS